MKRMRLRSGLITFALLLTAALGWLYLAPSQIGGPTAYVITHGTSMEPRFLLRLIAHLKLQPMKTWGGKCRMPLIVRFTRRSLRELRPAHAGA